MLSISLVTVPHSGWTRFRSARGRLFPIRVCASTRFGVAIAKLFIGFQQAASAIAPSAPRASITNVSLDPFAPEGGFPVMRTEGGPAVQLANAAAAVALASLHASCIQALLGGGSVATSPSAAVTRLVEIIRLDTSSASVFIEHLEPLGTRLSAIVDVRVSRNSGLDALLGVSPFVALVMNQVAGLEIEGARLDFELMPQACVVGAPAELLGPVQAELSRQGAAQALRLLGAIKGFSAPAAVLEVRL
jgi:hypothetical protein